MYICIPIQGSRLFFYASIHPSVHPAMRPSIHSIHLAIFPSFNTSFSLCAYSRRLSWKTIRPWYSCEISYRRSSKTDIPMSLSWVLALSGGQTPEVIHFGWPGHRSASGSRSLEGFSPSREPTPPGGRSQILYMYIVICTHGVKNICIIHITYIYIYTYIYIVCILYIYTL